MRRRWQVIPVNWLGAAVIALLSLAPLAALPSPAWAAKLVGGREQAAIRAAFVADAAHGKQLIVSIRASTVSPSWAVVKSVRPEGGGRTSSHTSPIRLVSTYYHRVGGQERNRRPPAPVRSDLAADFRIGIVYTGSGGESVRYNQPYRSVCAGAGGFVDQQASTISPMSWSVRYVVDLDHLVAAVASPQGVMIVPTFTFDAGDSSLSAVQTLSRTAVDVGCDGRPSTFRCTISYRLSGSEADGLLSFPFGLGTEIGVSTSSSGTGQCDPNDYTLGPSLWDSGAATALAGQLDLVDANLPGNPYAPVRVSWPNGSAALSQGFLASPCQGDGAACTDDFHWAGTVSLQAVPAS
jgi:hypothetical protein